MRYRVRITAAAEARIFEQARYIAVERQSPINAARWLERMLEAIETLDHWPRRCPKAEEDRYRPYDIHQHNVGGYLLLFTIREDTATVWVIGFRHGRMLPHPTELPDQSPEA